MLKITATMVAMLVLLQSACSPAYKSFIGTHQEKPFEVQVSKSSDQVWALFEKIIEEEQIPIRWKDKTSGVITSKGISFANSYAIENEDGRIDDPSARMVLARAMNGSSLLEPEQITGKWNLRVRGLEDNLSIVNVTLLSPRAHNAVNGQKTSLDIRSSGAFEKKVYAVLMGKSLKDLEKKMPNPTPSEKKEVVAPPPTQVAKKEMAVTEDSKPMAQEPSIVGEPEIIKPESMPATVDISNLVNEELASKEPRTSAPPSEPNAMSGSITILKKQIENQERIIKEQRKQLAELRNQKASPATIDQYQSALSNSQDANLHSEGLTVQFIALTESNKQFDKLTDIGKLVVEKVPNKNVYRYKIGHFANKLDAVRALTQIRSRGFGDAFINKKI